MIKSGIILFTVLLGACVEYEPIVIWQNCPKDVMGEFRKDYVSCIRDGEQFEECAQIVLIKHCVRVDR